MAEFVGTDPRVAEKLRARAEGKVEVQIYPAAQLVPQVTDPATLSPQDRFRLKMLAHEQAQAGQAAQEAKLAAQLPDAIAEAEKAFEEPKAEEPKPEPEKEPGEMLLRRRRGG